MIFTNQQIEETELPSVLDVKYRPIQVKYRLISYLTSFFVSLLSIGIPFVINTLSKETWFFDYIAYFFTAWLVVFLFLLLLSYQGYAHKGYALREHDIIYKEGWIWRSVTVVTFKRIQHTEIDQGPLERYYNLSKLKIYTAGGSSSDLTIPGLLPSTANKIKDYIQLKVGKDEEE